LLPLFHNMDHGERKRLCRHCHVLDRFFCFYVMVRSSYHYWLLMFEKCHEIYSTLLAMPTKRAKEMKTHEKKERKEEEESAEDVSTVIPV
jgi:hypothetical protein